VPRGRADFCEDPRMTRILITGASTGIGRATAIELADRGHEVVATARDVSTLDDLDVAARLPLDVTDQASVDAAVDGAGEIDVLVNNAGISHRGAIESYPIDLAEQVFATNTFGALRMMQALAPAMRERQRGTIVNVSSVEGFVTSPMGGIYSASKHALEAISEAARFELGHFGVRVVLIEPGYFATPIQHKVNPVPIDGTPYEELQRQWSGADAKLLGGERPGPEVVAVAIADTIADDAPPTRIPVGADAEMIATVRRQLDDASFEATMRDSLGLTW
jgi:NAD(P)-dependent dehydrogenase (short-subunit alcohol dehydrogenase family)